jgi:hypothetical protein
MFELFGIGPISANFNCNDDKTDDEDNGDLYVSFMYNAIHKIFECCRLSCSFVYCIHKIFEWYYPLAPVFAAGNMCIRRLKMIKPI